MNRRCWWQYAFILVLTKKWTNSMPAIALTRDSQTAATKLSNNPSTYKDGKGKNWQQDTQCIEKI